LLFVVLKNAEGSISRLGGIRLVFDELLVLIANHFPSVFLRVNIITLS